jgi:hypothetical protein
MHQPRLSRQIHQPGQTETGIENILNKPSFKAVAISCVNIKPFRENSHHEISAKFPDVKSYKEPGNDSPAPRRARGSSPST